MKEAKKQCSCAVLFHFYEIFAIAVSILNMGDFFSDVENVLELNRGKTTLWMSIIIYFKTVNFILFKFYLN